MSFCAPNIPADKHLFFDRFGGVSTGKYDSLNASLHSLDKRENIFQNLDIAAHRFGYRLEDLTILKQGTCAEAVYIDTPERYARFADGMVTDKKNIILAIRTADCAPIIFYDKQQHIIGAAHAGWRGALRGIIENTLDLMLSLGAQKQTIAAAIGPCLQKNSFECQDDMRHEFLQINSDYADFFTPKDDKHWLFDAENFCIHRLQTYGITNIAASHIDTYTDTDYFSYRRNCHRQLISAPKDYPSHLSTIIL